MSLRDAQQTVDRWIGQYKEGYFSPLTNLARLSEEVGELAREMLELADILFVVICIANSQHIDLDEAFAAMMAKVTARDAGRWTKKER